MSIEYKILNSDDDIATIAASLVDSVEPITAGGALVRQGDVHGIQTLTIDLGGTVFVIA